MKNQDEHYCPIFKKKIDDGLCWEVCFANNGISAESIPELVELMKESNLSLEEIQEKFCKHCYWDKK